MSGLEKLGSRLVLRRGRVTDELKRLCTELGTQKVHATAHYEPWWRSSEQEVAAELDLQLHEGNVLVPPERVRTSTGSPFKIYTPYWRSMQQHLPPGEPHPAPVALQQPDHWPVTEELGSWGLLPTKPNWAAGFAQQWTPGEVPAVDRLERFGSQVADYARLRDLPAQEGTSGFSPHLHFGEISPRQIWHGLQHDSGDKFLKELAWRDFAHNIMLTQPSIGEKSGRPEFENFPWREGRDADRDFEAWSGGRTGYPIVDAGMRQLWTTGWMHNRVRMIAASFLVKHLLIDWRRGAEWFWDTLVDADYGNNGQNWQWIAGTGVDSQPFNRIMAPLLQSEKFNSAAYIRRWVPELDALDDATIHDPSERPNSYPDPVVDHREARARALEALPTFRSR
jgi:deoxyribodipyrimidine photo-lyase